MGHAAQLRLKSAAAEAAPDGGERTAADVTRDTTDRSAIRDDRRVGDNERTRLIERGPPTEVEAGGTMSSGHIEGDDGAGRPAPLRGRESADALLWQEVVEHLPDAVVITRGPNHVVEYANAAFCHLAQQPGDRLVRRPLADTLAEPKDEAISVLDRVYAGGTQASAADRERRPRSEDSRHFTYTAWPAPESVGRTRGVILVVKDVTASAEARRDLSRLARRIRTVNERLVLSSVREQEHAEAAELRKAEFDALLETLGEGVIIADASEQIVMMNEAASRILGIESRAVVSLRDLNRLAARYVDDSPLGEDARPLVRALRGETFTDCELLHICPDGSARRLVSCGTSVKNETGEVALAIVVFHDVTELRRLEQQREEYAALISHDLRGPLTTILVSATMLKQTMQARGSLVETRIANRIAANAERMDGMIEELLEVASLQACSAELRLSPCDLAAVVAQAIERMDDGRRARVTIETAGAPCLAYADPARLDRAITNLVVNALKYSGEVAPVLVRLAAVGQEVSVEVVDQGIGIHEKDLPRLFDRFYRAPGDKRVDGLGLGLYITRLIAEAHGGRIAVSSQLGKGSAFRLVLPRMGEEGLCPPEAR